MAYKNNECNIFIIYLSDGAKKSLPTGCKNSRKEFVSHENMYLHKICQKHVCWRESRGKSYGAQ